MSHEMITPELATANQPQPDSSISAAAHAYQVAMQDQSANPPPALTLGIDSLSRDVTMAGTLTPDRAASPAIPAPTRTGTPSRTNGTGDANSRSTSVHPDPAPTQFPKTAAPNGAPARRYINERITPHLLDGLKIIAKEQPDDPLRILGEYLLQKSRELEGT